MLHKFICSANLLNSYYVHGYIQDTNRGTHKGKKKNTAVYSSEFKNVKCDTGLEFPSVHLLSVLLKEKLLCQEVLVKMENVHQHKF